MLILFDHSTPAPLRYALRTHTVVEAIERDWDRLDNGALLDAAETAGFDLFVTADKNLQYQQNLTCRKIAIVVLGNAQWPTLRRHLKRVVASVDAATPGSYTEVEILLSNVGGQLPTYFAYRLRAMPMSVVPLMMARPSGKMVIS